MRIAFLTTNEPFYLPDFFRYTLEHLDGEHDVKAVIVPPVYKGNTKAGLIFRYAKTFGMIETLNLTVRVIYYKCMDTLPKKPGGKYYSLSSVFEKYQVDCQFERDVNSSHNLNRLRNWHIDLAISISCPQIFKKDLIDLPRLGCLNLHGAILPQYRGVMPSFWVLANNEKEAGVTLFFVKEKIDAGDILIQKKFPISRNDTLDSLIRKSKRIGAEMVVEGVRMINSGKYTTRPLELEGGSYFGWPTRMDVLRFRANGRKFR